MINKPEIICFIEPHETIDRELLVSVGHDNSVLRYYIGNYLMRNFKRHKFNFQEFKLYEGKLELVTLKSFLFFEFLQKKIHGNPHARKH